MGIATTIKPPTSGDMTGAHVSKYLQTNLPKICELLEAANKSTQAVCRVLSTGSPQFRSVPDTDEGGYFESEGEHVEEDGGEQEEDEGRVSQGNEGE